MNSKPFSKEYWHAEITSAWWRLRRGDRAKYAEKQSNGFFGQPFSYKTLHKLNVSHLPYEESRRIFNECACWQPPPGSWNKTAADET